MFAIYTYSVLKKKGVNVKYTKNFNDIEKCDLCLVTSSIVCHETELNYIKKLKEKNIYTGVIGSFCTTLPDPYLKDANFVVSGEPEFFFLNQDIKKIVNEKPSGILNQVLISLHIINEPILMLFTEGAVIVGMVYVLIPFMFLPLYASIEKIDPILIQASKDLGANKFITFYKITLPLSIPGIIGGSILVFIPSLGNFIVPDLLGGAKVMMIGNLIEQSFLMGRNWPFGSALSMILMATVVIFLLFYVRSVSKYENATETIK